MAAMFAVLGFENSDGHFGFALTDRPIRYMDRLDDGTYARDKIEQDAALRWAVPVQTHGEAVTLRDRWNSTQVTRMVREVSQVSVPQPIIRDLYEIWWDGNPQSADEEALRLIDEHGTYVAGSEGSLDPRACPFIPLRRRTTAAKISSDSDVNLGIKLAIFDLDMTLVDSSRLDRARVTARRTGNWSEVERRIGEVASLKSWGGCSPHQLPRALADLGVKVALVSRARRSYFDSIVDRFSIYSDFSLAPCGGNKIKSFEMAMDRFGIGPGETVVFGDDKSDFRAAEFHGIISMGNPWVSTAAPAAPDIAWFDSASLIERRAWHQRFRYVGEADASEVEWHRGSLITFEDDAYALGRYFKRGRSRHQERLSQGIIAGKTNLSGDPHVLDAFRIAVGHLAKRIPVDLVISVPSHDWSNDRFAAYRQIVVREAGADEGVDVRTCFEVPRDYKGRSREYKRSTRDGRFEISEDLEGMTALLIDDNITTGSTLGALKDAAERAGATRVIQLAFGFTQD